MTSSPHRPSPAPTSRYGTACAVRATRVVLALACAGMGTAHASDRDDLRAQIDPVIQPLMAAHDIPGMSVAVTVGGKTQVLHYGVAAQGEQRAVDDRTLFEIGSVSKVFTGTLGAWAAAQGRIDLDAPASRYWPALAGTAFDRIPLGDLATYTAGGLPLQFPDDVTDEAGTRAYFQRWQPTYAPGTQRQYANPSIGLFGYLAARADKGGFAETLTQRLLPALGLEHTYLQVPSDQQDHYAFGVAKADARVRVSAGPLDAEAYGIKTTAADLLRLVQLTMEPASLDAPLRQALALAQTGRYQVGPMQQGLGWEIYPAPVSLPTVLAGNTPAMALEPQDATPIASHAPLAGRFVNKTGSTRGFGAYAAFLPDEQLGIVMLANRNYPNAERIQAAWTILQALR